MSFVLENMELKRVYLENYLQNERIIYELSYEVSQLGRMCYEYVVGDTRVGVYGFDKHYCLNPGFKP